MSESWKASGWISFAGIEAYVCRGEKPGPKVTITAGIHGDEYEGPLAVLELVQMLQAEEIRGTVMFIPVCNPGALREGTRLSPDGLNLARSFPGNVHGAGTEGLAAVLFEEIRQTSFAIDLHSGGVAYDFAPLAGFYGEPVAGNPSYEAARRFGLPYVWKLPATPGVLSNELWNLGIPAVGCEYGGSGRLCRTGVAAYVSGVCSCLRHWGALPGPASVRNGTVVAGDWQLASTSGFFVAEISIGDSVQAGETIARIIDGRGQEAQVFRAADSGLILAMRSKAFIQEGDWGILSVQRA